MPADLGSEVRARSRGNLPGHAEVAWAKATADGDQRIRGQEGADRFAVVSAKSLPERDAGADGGVALLDRECLSHR
jgi:hypothetical protein